METALYKVANHTSN